MIGLRIKANFFKCDLFARFKFELTKRQHDRRNK